MLVANRRLQPPPGHSRVTAVRVDGGPDAADQYIAAHAEAATGSRPAKTRPGPAVWPPVRLMSLLIRQIALWMPKATARPIFGKI